MGKIENIYLYHYKLLLLIPLFIFLISSGIIYYNYSTTGDFIKKNVALEGGITITVTSDQNFDVDKIHTDILEQFPNSDISVRQLTDFSTNKKIGVTIDMSDVKATEAIDPVSKILEIPYSEKTYSVEEIGSSLGASFFLEMIYAVIFSLLFMAITVWITFRKFIPSVAVISSIILELVTTVAILDLMGHKISPAGIAALLMVMGYSIDTDILLTTRVLKRDTGTLWQRIVSATKTGLTMTSTTICVSILMLLTPSTVLKEIFTIILIALVVDMISTWVMNSSLLIWYLERHKQHENK